MDQNAGLPGALVFGGPLSPIGWQLGFLEAQFAEVWAAHEAWRTDIEIRVEVVPLRGVALLDQLARLAPLETPPKRELVVAAGGGWTAHTTNDHLGGDSMSWVGHLSHVLGCRGVIATHIPRGQYRYPATQLQLFVQGGEVRTIACGIYDEGRWLFETYGPVQPFEEPERYQRRLKRERFDREMLLRYLAALGIRADEPDFYGDGVLVRNRARWRSRTTPLAEVQREYGIC